MDTLFESAWAKDDCDLHGRMFALPKLDRPGMYDNSEAVN